MPEVCTHNGHAHVRLLALVGIAHKGGDRGHGTPKGAGSGLLGAEAAFGFDFASGLFALQAAFFGAAAGLGFFAALGFVGGLLDEELEAIQDRRAVAFLGALGLGGDVEFVGGGEAGAGELAEAVDGGFAEAGDRGDGNPKLGAGVDLVDVLTAGAAAAGVLEAEGGLGDADARGEAEVGRRGCRVVGGHSLES